MNLVGRKKEIEELENLYNSGKPELVAVYGRRRVGKTFLIDKTFENRLSFRHAGVSPDDRDDSKKGLDEQLTQFYQSLLIFGSDISKKPTDWNEAFFELEKLLMKKNSKRIVAFLDELPWMDTPKSGFIRAFESFWNNWACYRDNVMVIVSGSSNSCILNKLVN
ncbi:MAG: AAA family ATPase, partial [Bacillales bacterium]|nr:AAA family ATPase [Bacillales bacterium]